VVGDGLGCGVGLGFAFGFGVGLGHGWFRGFEGGFLGSGHVVSFG
jgi:hypothetical protein